MKKKFQHQTILFFSWLFLNICILCGTLGCHSLHDPSSLNAIQKKSSLREVTGDETTISDLKPTVLLVSFDGFRPDYFDRYPTPNLHQMALEGVRAHKMMPIFPSLTFPNHYTLITGLYAEHHGIVANEMWDPDLKISFSLRERASIEDKRWWLGEPLWETAQKQGQCSGTVFWVGDTSHIHGVDPCYYVRPYNQKMPSQERIQYIEQWLKLPVDKRPTFLALYFNEADDMGHNYGPNSPQVQTAVEHLDDVTGNIISTLKSLGVYNQINIIIVSDHGMASIDPSRVIPLKPLLQQFKIRAVNSRATTVLFIDPTENKQKMIDTLKQVREHYPAFHFYTNKDIPKKYHFQHSNRLGDILCVADEGWLIDTKGEKLTIKGYHGYDNELPSMQAFFLAHGPLFKSHFEINEIHNVDLYELMAHLLSLKPAPNDGKWERIKSILK